MKKWPLRIINYLAGFMLLSSIHCTIVGMVNGGDNKTFLYSMVYLPVVVLLSESQKRAKYFWQFGVCAVLSLGIVHFINRSEFERILSVVLVIAAISLYFYSRAKKAECLLEVPEYHFLALYIVMYFLERQFPSEMLKTYAVVGAGIYCLLCMYQMNLSEILQLIDLSGHLERFPEKRLLKSNLLMMGFQTVIVGTGMWIVLSTGVDGILDKISHLVKKLFAWLLKFLESDAEQAGGDVSGGIAMMPFGEADEKSALMELILKIFDILSWIVVIALTLYVIYRILKKLYQLYLEFDMNSADNGDEIERLYTVQSKEEKRKIKKEKAENLRWDRSPNAKIRKHYKKRVLKDLKEIPKMSMTPEEIEKNVEMDVDKKEVFHRLYEKARYGNVDCTQEDVDKMWKSTKGTG